MKTGTELSGEGIGGRKIEGLLSMQMTSVARLHSGRHSASGKYAIYSGPVPDNADDVSSTRRSKRRTGFEWLKRAPRIRYRRPENRCPDQLLDLAVVNERLLGSSPWEVRRKVEYLKKRQENWDMVYEIIVRREAGATLTELEEASLNVENALSRQSKESKSVIELKRELVELQKEVKSAHERLHVTKSRVLQNLDRIQNLKKQMQLSRHTLDTGTLSQEYTEPSSKAVSMEKDMTNAWYPVSFSSRMRDKNVLVPFELFGQPWVLFRDASSNAACIQDECAHRACPLSIGKVVNGHVSCPYHGWEYNGDGSCVKMPSTIFRKGVSVNNLPVLEKNGFIWVWPGERSPSPEDLPEYAALPHGCFTLAETEKTVQCDKSLLLSNLLNEEYVTFSSLLRPWIGRTSIGHGNSIIPVDLAFTPPCNVTSVVDVTKTRTAKRRAHVHQLYVCLPAGHDKVRILHRICLDFWKWAPRLPFGRRIVSGFVEEALTDDLHLSSVQWQ